MSVNGLKNKGFALMEIMIASFVVVVGVIASYMVVQDIFADTFAASSRLTAAYLAEEGIEVVRNIRDTNWVEGDIWYDGLGKGPGFSGCNPGGAAPRECQLDYTSTILDDYDWTDPTVTEPDFLKLNGIYNLSAGSDTIFKRVIIIIPEVAADPDNSNYLEVTSEVFWVEDGVTKSIMAAARLYDWR